MDKLNKRKWYDKLENLMFLSNEDHEDYEVDLMLASLYLTLCDRHIWELPMVIYRSWLIEKAKKLHKDCCDLD